MKIPHPAFPSIDPALFSRRSLKEARAEHWGRVVIEHVLKHPAFGERLQTGLVFVDLLFFKDFPREHPTDHSYLGFVGFLSDPEKQLANRYLVYLRELLETKRGVGRHPDFQEGFGAEKKALKLATRLKLPATRLASGIADVVPVLPSTLEHTELPEPSKYSAEDNFSHFVEGLSHKVSTEDGEEKDVWVLAVPLFALDSYNASFGGAVFVAVDQQLPDDVVLAFLGHLVHSIAISDGLRVALEVFFDVYSKEELANADTAEWRTLVAKAHEVAADGRADLPRHHMRGGSEEALEDDNGSYADSLDSSIRMALQSTKLKDSTKKQLYEGTWSGDRMGIPYRALIGGNREGRLLSKLKQSVPKDSWLKSDLCWVDCDLSRFFLAKTQQLNELTVVIPRPLLLEYFWFNAAAVVSGFNALMQAHTSLIRGDQVKCPAIVEVSDGVSQEQSQCWIRFRVLQTRVLADLRREMPTLHNPEYEGSGRNLRQFEFYMHTAGAHLLREEPDACYSSCYEIAGELVGLGYQVLSPKET